MGCLVWEQGLDHLVGIRGLACGGSCRVRQGHRTVVVAAPVSPCGSLSRMVVFYQDAVSVSRAFEGVWRTAPPPVLGGAGRAPAGLLLSAALGAHLLPQGPELCH